MNNRLVKNALFKLNGSDRVIISNTRNTRRLLEERRLLESFICGDSIISPVKNNIVVSLTTYNKRINTVYLTIESIAAQTVKPDRIILWLDKDEICLNELPFELIKQQCRGLEIKFTDNIKSYKKIIPTLLMGISEDCITIDDDILYPPLLIEKMLFERDLNPGVVLAGRAHKFKFGDDGLLLNYIDWDLDTKDHKASLDIFPTGVGGVLYPNGCFDEQVCHADFLSIAPNADDIWLKAMTKLKGNKCKRIRWPKDFWDDFLSLDEVQDIALCKGNLYRNENDIAIEAISNTLSLDWSSIQ